MTVLSVNLNKVAVLRNSRGGALPSVSRAGAVCLDAGCAGLTVHPRPDQRHIRATDVRELARELGADRIEIYTGPYAQAFGAGDPSRALARCADLANRAHALGLGVNAGHDLSRENLAAFVGTVPHLAEVSIGHALFSEAIYDGLEETVRSYLRILAT